MNARAAFFFGGPLGGQTRMIEDAASTYFVPRLPKLSISFKAFQQVPQPPNLYADQYELVRFSRALSTGELLYVFDAKVGRRIDAKILADEQP